MEHLRDANEKPQPIGIGTYGQFIFQMLSIGLEALPSMISYKESPETQQLLLTQERELRERRGKTN